MSEGKEVKSGDPCPLCGGAFRLEVSQAPEALISRHKRAADRPDVAARYAEQVHAKIEEVGLLHVCAGCGYRSRFKPAARGRTAA